LQGVVRERQADVGKVAAGQEADFLVAQELAGQADRVLRPAGVIAREQLQLAAQHAAGGVELVSRELHAVAVRQGEGGLGGVAVDLADADWGGALGAARARCQLAMMV